MTADLCPGQSDSTDRLVGICVCCARHADKAPASTKPPAVRDELGRWSCERLVAPAGWPAWRAQG